MNNLKHTPGPWEVNIYNGCHVLSPRDGSNIASCNIPNYQANARLISAAPEMLEALLPEHLKLSFDSNGNVCLRIPYEKYVETIEKATGLTIEEILK